MAILGRSNHLIINQAPPVIGNVIAWFLQGLTDLANYHLISVYLRHRQNKLVINW